jgi:hypothetical protein
MGSGGNFVRTLKVDGLGHILVKGHLDLFAEDEPVKMYFWCYQFRPAGLDGDAVAAGFLDAEGLGDSTTEWTALGDVVYDGGKFTPGVAIGTALLILKDAETGKTKARSWTDTLQLE